MTDSKITQAEQDMARSVEEFYGSSAAPLSAGVRSQRESAPVNKTDQQGPVDPDAIEYRVIFRGSRREYQLSIPEERLYLSGSGNAPAWQAREYIARKTGRPTRKIRVALEHEPIPGQDF